MARIKPLEALAYGFAAGAIGAFLQNLFFKTTSKIAPAPPKDAFDPPEAEQKNEMPTATVARRVVEDLAQRPPLDEAGKEKAKHVVHYAFGSAWGAAYGLLRESVPALASVGGAVAWSSFVWMAADNFILPVFRLAGWPRSYPVKTHAYAWAAHVAYGLGVVGAYEALRARPLLVAATAFRVRRLASALPEPARKPARRAAWQAVALKRRLPELLDSRLG
jgi:hypothetical protein